MGRGVVGAVRWRADLSAQDGAARSVELAQREDHGAVAAARAVVAIGRVGRVHPRRARVPVACARVCCVLVGHRVCFVVSCVVRCASFIVCFALYQFVCLFWICECSFRLCDLCIVFCLCKLNCCSSYFAC